MANCQLRLFGGFDFSSQRENIYVVRIIQKRVTSFLVQIEHFKDKAADFGKEITRPAWAGSLVANVRAGNLFDCVNIRKITMTFNGFL